MDLLSNTKLQKTNKDYLQIRLSLHPSSFVHVNQEDGWAKKNGRFLGSNGFVTFCVFGRMKDENDRLFLLVRNKRDGLCATQASWANLIKSALKLPHFSTKCSRDLAIQPDGWQQTNKVNTSSSKSFQQFIQIRIWRKSQLRVNQCDTLPCYILLLFPLFLPQFQSWIWMTTC